MARRRPTVADIRAMKGKRQLTMLRVMTLDEAEAAERAGVDIVSIPPELLFNPQYRDAAPSLFSMPGDNFYEFGTADDFVRFAFKLYKAGADAVYCAAGFPTVKRLAEDNIPVIGHVGLIPSRATWTGGFKAVGKTADSALQIFEAVKKYEAIGAFGAEIEVVPVEVAEAISKRTSLIMLSMGAGTGCDAQYLFAEDVLGTNRGHMPTAFKGLSQLRCRVRPAAGRAGRCLLRVRGRREFAGLPRGAAHRQNGSCRAQAVHGQG